MSALSLHTESAFKSFYLTHAESLRNFLYYKTGDLKQAEDLMQEAFLKLWQKRQEVQPEKAKSFLFTVANNLFLDKVRHQKVVRNYELQPRSDRDKESPEYHMEVQEFKQQLEAVLAGLTEASRVVFLMNRLEDLSYKEIAARLGISQKAVEKRMSKALKELRKLTKKI